MNVLLIKCKQASFLRTLNIYEIVDFLLLLF